ncbi:bifunctional DNA-binding transcriptional regulator/O6-methylguanine-DNA methyltransferase Ada [Candidatus Chloroploca sp. Khr17]|uniref:bifunctional DNA-binding transcriptional regulator/O6-methylguanine-DNA methyltransferase Ada n=1 Tax=Candidatus Chloroploca sp. Khr17 TaxID=2496869 RepID=UPI00101D6D2B|nr:bifunctional DNA-binding transcriptional regulator/O6-methylguanine-DNA methyltransferase Ada [Candidatus Chloroploca sp. Khr17]
MDDGETESRYWHVLVSRAPMNDEVFYYAVRTTGIFCRPGCASRLPRREHVLFFATCAEALLAGFRPCKRCQPDKAPDLELTAMIVQACRRIDHDEQAPSLATLAAEAGLSPWHFQRVFKRHVGVTPKQYAMLQRSRRLRERLKHDQSVTEAIYDAGFASSSRAYEDAALRFGMSLSRYKDGAVGMIIAYSIAESSLGLVLVATTERGLCAVEFGDDEAMLLAQLRASFPHAELQAAGPDAEAILQQVLALVEQPERTLDLPLDIQGTAFQERVWQVLRTVPVGSTISYSELAERIDNPKAVRAVASACAANRLAVVIPCHRVVRSDGALSGYRWGIERKRALLQREQTTES